MNKYPNTPPELAQLHEKLRAHVVDLVFEWQLWKSLFRESEERIKLLNATAPSFFARVEATIFQDVVLRIGRLLDSPQTARQDNLVLEQLLLRDPQLIPQALNDSMAQVLASAKARTAAVKKWRHKYLAHMDMKHALLAEPPADAEIKFADIDDIIAMIGDYLNLFHQEFEQTASAYTAAGEIGHERLIRRLKDSELFSSLPPEVRRKMQTGI